MSANITLAAVEKGQRLPDLSIDVGVTNVVLGALASRDVTHRDVRFAFVWSLQTNADDMPVLSRYLADIPYFAICFSQR